MVDEKAVLEGLPTPKWKLYMQRISGTLWFMIFLTLIFLAFLSLYWTKPINNVYYMNVSDESHTIHYFEPNEVPEGYQEYIWYGKYNPDGTSVKVPRNSFGKGMFTFVCLIYIFFIFILMQREKETEGITGKQATNLLKDIFYVWEKEGTFQGKCHIEEPISQANLIYEKVGEKREPVKWCIPFYVEWGTGNLLVQHYVILFDYKTGNPIKWVESKPFNHSDTCPKCGKYCDYKIETTEELRKNMEFFKGLGGVLGRK